jgi:hypothetical protein
MLPKTRREFLPCISVVTALVSVAVVTGCGKKEQLPSIPNFPDIDFADAISQVFEIATIAIPYGKLLKLSFGLGAKVLALDAKIANKYGEISFKIPFNADKRISDRDALIQSLKLQIADKKVVDDGTFILIIKFPNETRAVPIKKDSNICSLTSGTHLTKYSTVENRNTAEVTALNQLSIIEVGNCTEMQSLIAFTVEIREDSEVALYGDVEYFKNSENSWVPVGKGPRVKFFAEPGAVRIRVSSDGQKIWDGVLEGYELPDNCPSVKLMLFLPQVEAMQTYTIRCNP